MSYTPFTWADGAAGGTPIIAARLNAIEQGLHAAAANADRVSAIQLAPLGTNNSATDTANLQNAITAAQAVGADLVLPTGVPYKINAGLTWNLAKGSIRTWGPVDIIAAEMTSGVALTITGNPTAGTGNYFVHRAATNVVSGLRLVGPDTDTATVDGILISDTGIGVDQGALEHLIIYGFRDGLTYGTNEWSIDHRRVSVANSHRYGINLSHGVNAGQCTSFTAVSVFNSHNAAGTAVGVFVPAGGSDARFLGGALQYNDIEGVFNGGNVTFFGTRIEDSGSGPAFTYSCSTGGADTNVMFRDCDWEIETTTARDHIHEITASSRFRISVMFDGGVGSVFNATGPTWVVDNSGDNGLGVQVNYRNFNVNIQTGSNTLLLGDMSNVLFNGYFNDTTSFVSGGTFGWTAGTGNTWSIGAGGRTGNALKVTGSGAGNDFTTQQIPVTAGQPIRVSGYLSTPTWTSGNISIFVQFFTEDRVTSAGNPLRVGSALSALQTGWSGVSRIIRVPRAATYMTVQLNCANLNGVGLFDNIEVVPS